MADHTHALLQRLLDHPQQVASLRRVPARDYPELVRAVGLDDAGELLALATGEQMVAVLDDLLWDGTGPDPEERLCAGTFVRWLEVLLDQDEPRLAQRLRGLPETLLAAGLSGQLFVLGLDALGHGMAGCSWREAKLAEALLDAALYIEFDHFTLIARDALGWDPCLAALLALDRVDHGQVVRLLTLCEAATREEMHGHDPEQRWQTLLSAQDSLKADAFAGRDERRSRMGFVSKSHAAGFMAAALSTRLDDPASLAEDPLTRAYFRDLVATHELAPCPEPTPDPSDELLRLVVARSEGETRASATVDGLPDETLDGGTQQLRAALATLATRDPTRHGFQLTRLAYLANVLLTHGQLRGTHDDPCEASSAVLRVCERGLDQLRARVPGRDAVEVLERYGCDALFRLGWSEGE